ncbi:uncharacterized protein LOC135342213 isoform X2 [Halichondria panicea]|uniref:uncharacterized protein LOC135342213 isoform X2 n=1 Tax=Halichondria panicea TaxID=6063 RepID=UPI00312B792E
MAHLTLIARASDGLPLSSSIVNEEAKQIFRKLSSVSPPRCSIECDPGRMVFHYILEEGICYLALCDPTYPAKLAFNYLENLHKDFSEQHGNDVHKASRPYHFIEFGLSDKAGKLVDYSRMADQLMQHVSISLLLWIGSGLLVHTLVYWRQYLPSFTRDVYKYGKLRSESDWSWMIHSVPKTQGGGSPTSTCGGWCGTTLYSSTIPATVYCTQDYRYWDQQHCCI